MERDPRQNTNIILQMIEDDVLDAKTVALACMKYMSEDDVTEMAIANEFIAPMEDELEDGLESESEEDSDDTVEFAFKENFER